MSAANARREIPHLQASMYYFNTLLTISSRLYARLKRERVFIHSWRLIEQVTCQQRMGDLKHMHVKNHRYFSHVEIGFFSVVEIPIKDSSLCDKYIYCSFKCPETKRIHTEVLLQVTPFRFIQQAWSNESLKETYKKVDWFHSVTDSR